MSEEGNPISDARGDEVLLAYALNGQPLPPQHGYPLRLLVPGWYGMSSMTRSGSRPSPLWQPPFEGYQQAHAYIYRTDPDSAGEPLSRIAPRSLMIPPGVPEFWSRQRLVPVGSHVLEGRTWSGWGAITAVTVSSDGGATWRAATVEDPPATFAWCPWAPTYPATLNNDLDAICNVLTPSPASP